MERLTKGFHVIRMKTDTIADAHKPAGENGVLVIMVDLGQVTLVVHGVHFFAALSLSAVHAATTSRSRPCSACRLWTVSPSRLDPDR